MISPLLFLGLLIAATLVLLAMQFVRSRVHQRTFMTLAREWRMHYAADDRFNLAARVAERLPLPGAADVRVVDLIYGMEDGRRRYLFSAHYTRGVVRWKRRFTCVACLTETREEWSDLSVAADDLPLTDQYRLLADVKR